MKNTLLLLFFLLMCSKGVIAQQTQGPVVSPEWLTDRLNDDNLLILHVESSISNYEKEHIPGAVFISTREFVYDSGDQVYDLPTVDKLTEILRSKGLSNDRDVLIYVANNSYTSMGRLYYTLNYLSHGEKTYLLDGGINNWKAQGGSTTDKVSIVKNGDFVPKANPDLLVDMPYVAKHYQGDTYDIVDARAEVFYTGIQPGHAGRKGHIPGAKTIPFTSILKEGEGGSYVFLSTEELQSIFDKQGLSKDKPIILYCHIGQQATLVFTAAQILGYNARLFDGSDHEWGSSEHPLEVN